MELPKRVRRWILTKKISQDDVRSRQEYPQLNNTYAEGEHICALRACVGRDVEPDPLNREHWSKEFSYAVFYGLDPKDSTRAQVKYENDLYEIDHDQEELVKVVPLGVIIKQKAERRDHANEQKGRRGILSYRDLKL